MSQAWGQRRGRSCPGLLRLHSRPHRGFVLGGGHFQAGPPSPGQTCQSEDTGDVAVTRDAQQRAPAYG